MFFFFQIEFFFALPPLFIQIVVWFYRGAGNGVNVQETVELSEKLADRLEQLKEEEEMLNL